MGIYEELQARGLIAQVTDGEQIRELVNNGKPPSTLALTARRTACTWATSWPCA